MSASALLLLAGCPRTTAQDPVAFDGSQSREMQVVWTRTDAPTGFGAYFQNVADIPNNNFVSLTASGVRRTWRTFPTLDTTANVVQWIGGIAYYIAAPLDYDGVPPMEFFSGRNIFRPSLDGKVMTAIDTVDCFGDNPSFKPRRYRVDVDGDGLLDIAAMTNSAGDSWFAAILNGPGRTVGCSNVLYFPNIFKNRPQPERESTPVRLMRCADGKLRIVYVGSIHEYRSGVYLLDVHVQPTDIGYAVSYTMADSIDYVYTRFGGQDDPWIVRPNACVDDAQNGHQYALVDWQDGWHRNHNTTVMYEVTNGKLVERVSTVGHFAYRMTPLDNAFDNGPAMIMYGRDGFLQFARIDEFYRPFAKVDGAILGGILGNDWAFVDDQFNDGSRDFMTGAGNKNIPESNFIRLINFDLRPTSVSDGDSMEQSWVSLETGRLRFSLEHPSPINVDAVNSLGQKRPLIVGFIAPAGPSVLDITPQLQALPNGAWFVRVSDGVRMVSMSYLR